MDRPTCEVPEEGLQNTAQDKHKDHLSEESLKRVRTSEAGSDVLGLTCAEANVDAILSDGESI